MFFSGVRPNFATYPYSTLAFLIDHFNHLSLTVPYRFSIKIPETLALPLKTEVYPHILLLTVINEPSADFNVFRFHSYIIVTFFVFIHYRTQKTDRFPFCIR